MWDTLNWTCRLEEGAGRWLDTSLEPERGLGSRWGCEQTNGMALTEQ